MSLKIKAKEQLIKIGKYMGTMLFAATLLGVDGYYEKMKEILKK